jgi:hypothetical protein
LPVERALPLLEGRWTSDDCSVSYSEYKFNNIGDREATYNYVNLVGTRKNLKNLTVNISVEGDNIILKFPGITATTQVIFRSESPFENVMDE